MRGFNWNVYGEKGIDFMRRVIFSPETDPSVRSEYGYRDLEDYALTMNVICDSPNLRFVKKYRKIIEDTLFDVYPEVFEKIFPILEVEGESREKKFSKLRTLPSSNGLLNAYGLVLSELGGCDDLVYSEYYKYGWTVQLNMKATAAEDIELYDFQRYAVKALEEHFIKKDNQRGLLVMPTGSGKSRTASYFLIRKMISRGYKILWIAHRHMLINQAAKCFDKFAGLSKLENPKLSNYKISCISSEHQSIKSVDDDSNVIVCSIQSICRNVEHLRRITKGKVMIVVDEAHHTFAPSYQKTIRDLFKRRRNIKLLGLTATPVRANDNDSAALLKLFDNNIVYKISLSKLIAMGILANPHPVEIRTNENFEPQINENEAEAIRRRHDLPESVLMKIASSKARNQTIVREYLDNADKYGKTLIFALNVIHCRFLCGELKKHKLKCDCIYSGKENNTAVIEKFRNNELDVLVNVNIMTEGSDVPDIETVFLTRPTQSEGFLMQMIGRGMRGKESGGTENVYIVDFHDKWNVFNKWLNPKWYFGEVEDEPEYVEREYAPAPKVEYIPWERLRDEYNAITIKQGEYNKIVSIPLGWYDLIDSNGEDYILYVFEDQVGGYKNIKKNIKQITSRSQIDYGAVAAECFPSYCMRPSELDIMVFIDNMVTFEEKPLLNMFADRKKIDPAYVAEEAEKSGRDIFKLAEQRYKDYPMAEKFYGDVRNYVLKVVEAKIYKSCDTVYGRRVCELPEEEIPFDRTPCYNLNELTSEVINEMFGGSYEGISSISWTDKPYKTFYGRYFHNDNRIEINNILNSKDVPREVVKFVIYHEFLHRDYIYHDKDFKREEHKYKNFEDCEHFLDGNMNKFDIEEW